MNPLVTIITPTFQQQDQKSLHRMLASVQTQTYYNWEHIVCSDGGHEQHIANDISVYGESRRQYTCSSQHHGGYGAGVRNEIMRMKAQGKYLCFLDDDNFLMPDYLEKMVGALEGATNGERFAICKILHFGPVRQDVGLAPLYLKGEPKLCFIDTLQIMVHADTMKEMGWIKPEDYCSDGYTYEELGKRYKYVRVDDCLAVHL